MFIAMKFLSARAQPLRRRLGDEADLGDAGALAGEHHAPDAS
jgi:hypothetical protein